MSCLLLQIYLNFTFCYDADNMARQTSSIHRLFVIWYMIPPEQNEMLILIIRRTLFNCSFASFQSVSFEDIKWILSIFQLRGWLKFNEMLFYVSQLIKNLVSIFSVFRQLRSTIEVETI